MLVLALGVSKLSRGEFPSRGMLAGQRSRRESTCEHLKNRPLRLSINSTWPSAKPRRTYRSSDWSSAPFDTSRDGTKVELEDFSEFSANPSKHFLRKFPTELLKIAAAEE